MCLSNLSNSPSALLCPRYGSSKAPDAVQVSQRLRPEGLFFFSCCQDSDLVTDILCYNARGGVFVPSKSQTWESLGAWELGSPDLPYGGNGDYGLESLAFTDTLYAVNTGVNHALVAAINDTDYYQGFIGVGVDQGRFGTNVTNPLITQLAETYGVIPSHSYGYTAGANYGKPSYASFSFLVEYLDQGLSMYFPMLVPGVRAS